MPVGSAHTKTGLHKKKYTHKKTQQAFFLNEWDCFYAHNCDQAVLSKARIKYCTTVEDKTDGLQV